MNKPLVVPATDRISTKDLENAAEDARLVNQNSKIVQACVVSMIASRQLYMMARSALDNELQHGWDMDNPGLVVQTLVMSAQNKSVEAFTANELLRTLFETVIAFTDIIARQERETGQTIAVKETTDAESDCETDPGADPSPVAGGPGEPAADAEVLPGDNDGAAD